MLLIAGCHRALAAENGIIFVPRHRKSEEEMAAEKWVVVEKKHCVLIDQDVEIKERRVYPTADFLQMVDNGHRLRACTCSAAAYCNMAGISCEFAYNTP